MANAQHFLRSAHRAMVVGMLALSLTACGGRFGRFDASNAAGIPVATSESAMPDGTSGPSETNVAGAPSAPATPVAAGGAELSSTSPATPAPTVTLPNLSGIDPYLTDLDAALGADATADTDEGSSK